MIYNRLDPYVDEMEGLIDFYKSQYLKFKRIGLRGMTEHNVMVTQTLIDCTANRLDQLIKGEKTSGNMCRTEKIIRSRGRGFWVNDDRFVYIKKYNSNRSFGWDNTSIVHLSERARISIWETFNNRYISDKHVYAECQPVYIDKITTAYKSDIMVATLSHDN